MSALPDTYRMQRPVTDKKKNVVTLHSRLIKAYGEAVLDLSTVRKCQ